jgi:hypothetical protein
VGALADRCPSCDGDPDLRLIDLGGSPRRREAAGRRPPASGGRGWAGWAPLVAGFVGLWALVAILAGGSAGDRSPEEEARTPTTGGERDTTTRPPTTSTTALVPGAPLVGPPDGLGLVLIGDGAVTLLDLDSGAVSRLRTRGVYGVVGRSLLVDGDAGLELWPAPFDGVEATLLTDTVPMMAWVADSGREIWTVDVSDGGGRARLLRPDGEVILTHELRELGQAAWPIGATDGGLIVGAPGGTYLLGDGGGIDRVSTGSPVAAGGRTVHVATCDERLHCGIESVDETGQLLGPRFEGATLGYGTAAPDGRLAYSGPAEGAFRRSVLVDGRVVLEATGSDLDAAAWSPDGRWLAVLGPGNVTLVDTFVGTPPVVVEVDRTYRPWQAYFVELS